MEKKNKVISILREYMGFNCACGVADEIDKLYKLCTNCNENVKGNNDMEYCDKCYKEYINCIETMCWNNPY